MLFKFGLPSIGLQIWMGIYTLLEAAIASIFISTDALSVVNLVSPILSVEDAIGGMLGTGAVAIIGEKIGEGKAKEGGRDLSLIVTAMLVLGVAWGWIAYGLGDSFYRFIGVNDHFKPMVSSFISIHRWFAGFYVLQMGFQALLILAGKPNKAMVITLISGLLNIFAAWLLVGIWKLDIVGIAIASGLGALFAAVASVLCVLNPKDELHMRRPSLSPGLIWQSCKSGVGDLICAISMATITVLLNINTLKYFGDNGCAAGAVLLYAQFLFVLPFIGLGKGISPIIACRYGIDDDMKLQDIVRKYLILFTAIVFVTGISAFFMDHIVIIMYGIDRSSPVYDIVQNAWFIFSLQYVFAGINYMAQYLFTSFEDGSRAGFVSALHGIILPNILLLVLPAIFRGVGIWLAFPLSEAISAIVTVAMVLTANREYHYFPQSKTSYKRR